MISSKAISNLEPKINLTMVLFLQQIHVPVLPLQSQHQKFECVQMMLPFNRLILLPCSLVLHSFQYVPQIYLFCLFGFFDPLERLSQSFHIHLVYRVTDMFPLSRPRYVFFYCDPHMFCISRSMYVSSIAIQICFIYLVLLMIVLMASDGFHTSHS